MRVGIALLWLTFCFCTATTSSPSSFSPGIDSVLPLLASIRRDSLPSGWCREERKGGNDPLSRCQNTTVKFLLVVRKLLFV